MYSTCKNEKEIKFCTYKYNFCSVSNALYPPAPTTATSIRHAPPAFAILFHTPTQILIYNACLYSQ